MKVESKNEWGWSQTSDVFRFYTRNKGGYGYDDGDDNDDDDDNIDVNDDISDVESWKKDEAVNQVLSLLSPRVFYHLAGAPHNFDFDYLSEFSGIHGDSKEFLWNFLELHRSGFMEIFEISRKSWGALKISKDF